MNKTLMEKVSFACMVVFAVVMVGVVQISFVFLLISLSSVLVVRPAFGQSIASQGNAGVRLEAGIAKEEADGDLKAAMTVYQQIAGDASAPRAIRAKALLRLARCDEKLGQQARQLYEQIVRDYADQPVATQARIRLTAMKQQDQPAAPATMTVRHIEMPQRGFLGVTDTDGQRTVYRDASGDLYFGDLAGHSKRLIFKGTTTLGWQPSRDFSSVLLELPEKQSGLLKLAVVNTDGSGFRKIPGSKALQILDWSPDKRSILATDLDPHKIALGLDHRKIVIVDAIDGSERVLTTTKNKPVRTARFSPDGHLVAFDTRSDSGRIFVVPAEGGKTELLFDNAQLLDWTIDGRFLALSIKRNGADALSLLPVKEGTSTGQPLFIRFGSFEEAYVTAKGSLVYSTIPAEGRLSVSLSNFDGAGHPGPWQRLDLKLGNRWNPFPAWSPDSQSILYTSRNDAVGQTRSTLILRDLFNGKEREIYTGNDDSLDCVWSPKPDHLVCDQQSAERTDFLSIAVDSGESEILGSLPGKYDLMQASRDGGSLYLWEYPGYATKRWVIATGKISAVDETGAALPSWNENWLLRENYENSEVLVRPIAEDRWRKVASAARGAYPYFTPDDHWILYTVEEAGKLSLFRVPVTGGTPERLGDYPQSGGGNMSVSPDGKKILAVSYQNKSDLSILENFVPKAAKAESSR